MPCIVDYIRAQNGQLLRMCCTLGMDTWRPFGDAQIARIAYNNLGTLRCRFDAL